MHTDIYHLFWYPPRSIHLASFSSGVPYDTTYLSNNSTTRIFATSYTHFATFDFLFLSFLFFPTP
ncbi:hypothetical protein BYT27DRAFT_7179436 [Phlegmacium glaucopus]|nr:hypothetical protein BYT27DRAFT_7179436 [Phlegmacium glaucopus]